MFNSCWKDILRKSMGLKQKRLFQSVLKMELDHRIEHNQCKFFFSSLKNVCMKSDTGFKIHQK